MARCLAQMFPTPGVMESSGSQLVNAQAGIILVNHPFLYTQCMYIIYIYISGWCLIYGYMDMVIQWDYNGILMVI